MKCANKKKIIATRQINPKDEAINENSTLINELLSNLERDLIQEVALEGTIDGQPIPTYFDLDPNVYDENTPILVLNQTNSGDAQICPNLTLQTLIYSEKPKVSRITKTAMVQGYSTGNFDHILELIEG